MFVTIEQLPAAANQLFNKLENIEQLLLKMIPTQANNSEELLTIKQAANFLNLSVQTIYALNSKQKIPSMKKGKRLYFSKQELTAWIKSGKKQTIAEANREADNYLINHKKRSKQL